MNNKRGWLRILEVIIAIMILTGVVLVVYSQRPNNSTSISEKVYNLQEKILNGISEDNILRDEVLNNNIAPISDFVNQSFLENGAGNLNFSVKICELSDPCGLDPDTLQMIKEKEIYVDEKVIGSDLDTYSPKKIRIFVWEK